ncbi:MAG: redoxin domain-containing protein [Planctomycetes bacterium]|nr:redoxin domain-containing protein [Planctomycetota bacterium]
MARYADSEALPPLVAAITRRSGDFGAERTRVYLDRILAENKHAEVQAEALLARAKLYFARRPLVKNASKAELDAGRADLRRGLELATAVGGKGVGRQPVAPNQPLVERVDGVLFEAEHLQIGHVAPDIIGKDLDGVEFRLSDYRGKVVMLDFWGHW